MPYHSHDRSPGSGYSGSLMEARDRNSDAYELSVHGEGKHHLYAGQNAGCAYCHAHDGFTYRAQNNAQPTHTLAAGKWTYSFSAPASVSSALPSLPGRISCFTCHKGAPADSMARVSGYFTSGFAAGDSGFYNNDSVGITLWAMPTNYKWGKLPQDGGSAHLCLSCHQARPINYNTTSGYGNNVLDSLLLSPTDIIWDSTKTTSTGNKLSVGYRTGGHYGWPGNILLGVGYGPPEIAGSTVYENSEHTTVASCVNCHMAPPKSGSDVSSGEAVIYGSGGHTFSARRNFNGCNADAVNCHTGMSATNATYYVPATTNQKALLDSLGELLTSKGQYLMMIDNVPYDYEIEEGNLWYYMTTKHFNGYLNIYDATYNPGPGVFKANTTSSPGTDGFYKWPTMTKGQFAVLMAFQANVREYSKGVHNTKYSNALLRNAIEYILANPFP
ncbi:MAG: hypothetical protein HYY40_01580 [Bacteroidetes bacterium]|nr:hypothetical protein [Bacteroidota bacterium]